MRVLHSHGAAKENLLSTLYLITLVGVSAAVLALLWDAVVSVSRRPDWDRVRSTFSIVPTIERRTYDIPFVGRDRRRSIGVEELCDAKVQRPFP